MRRPRHHHARLLVRDHLHVRKRLLVDLGAVPVIPMPVRVDDVADRLRGEGPDLGEHGRGGGRRAVGVEHQHAVVRDDGDGVAVEADVAVRAVRKRKTPSAISMRAGAGRLGATDVSGQSPAQARPFASMSRRGVNHESPAPVGAIALMLGRSMGPAATTTVDDVLDVAALERAWHGRAEAAIAAKAEHAAHRHAQLGGGFPGSAGLPVRGRRAVGQGQVPAGR